MAGRQQLDLDQYLPYLINRVGAALVANFTTTALARHDLSIAMWRVLAALSANGEQRQIDIAGMTSIDVSTLSRLVSRLMRRGLVTRRRSETNSREVVVQLSPKGRALVHALIPVARRLQATAIAGISRQDLAVVKRSLRRMHGNMTGGAPISHAPPGVSGVPKARKKIQKRGPVRGTRPGVSQF